MKNSIIKNFQDWTRIMEAAPAPAAAPAAAPTTQQITNLDGAMTKDDLKQVQSIVFGKPITDPVCDGLMGEKTRAAIDAYKVKKGITSDSPPKPEVRNVGVGIGEKTLAAVKQDIEAALKPAATAAPVSTDPSKFTRTKADDDLAGQICNSIVAKWGDTSFWKEFKDKGWGYDDDEVEGKKAYTSWFNSSIKPKLSTFKPGDPNKQKIEAAHDDILDRMLGDSSDDSVMWEIELLGGATRAYTVDTDF